jgi:hypothetical protein
MGAYSGVHMCVCKAARVLCFAACRSLFLSIPLNRNQHHRNRTDICIQSSAKDAANPNKRIQQERLQLVTIVQKQARV